MVNSINNEDLKDNTLIYVNGLHHPTKATWNQQSIELINNLNPNFVAIDGLAPDSETWAIEAQAANFNTSQLLILAGEPISYATNYPGIKKGSEVVNSILAEDFKSETDVIIYLITAASIGAAALSINAQLELEQKMSRRFFLGLASATALSATGSLITGTKLFGTQAILNKIVEIENIKDRQKYEDLVATMDNFIYPTLRKHRWWVDGRTAFITEKAIDFQEKSPDNITGAILMGMLHGIKGPEYAENPDLRLKDIAIYLAEIKKGLDNFSLITGKKIDKQQKYELSIYFSSYQIHELLNGKAQKNEYYYDQNILNTAIGILLD